MANNYLRDPKTPFFSLEDDVDDETFLRSAPPRYPTSSNYGVGNHYQNYNDELQRKQQELIERRKMIEERTIQSSERSLKTLLDTEHIGIATAEELIKQREQLERTDRRLDDINSTLRFSQKHIQGIKSVFGGLKNYFSGSKSMELPNGSSASGLRSPTSPLSPTSESILAERLNSSAQSTRRSSEHPYLRVRGLTEEEEMDNFQQTHLRNAAAVLEQNLDEMSGSIATLKNLAIGLSEEINTQNDLIDNITDKAERADITIQRQNKDIRNLLKK
ncbi:synaptosomal-associated protein 29 [Copidosoma floridanum]|uniref:synaptosomal-associated protein 29 n=1 Tax=Copidosoma floridanum TaxID=29053 RepID=UPI0006C960FC|nr:synaptosomal-associated protein 29 [Copidosoma floridanum]